jgi:hypothetical protein
MSASQPVSVRDMAIVHRVSRQACGGSAWLVRAARALSPAVHDDLGQVAFQRGLCLRREHGVLVVPSRGATGARGPVPGLEVGQGRFPGQLAVGVIDPACGFGGGCRQLAVDRPR